MKNTIGELSDAMGQRISKTVTNKNVTMGDKFVTTYYVRDPQGNVLAVYEHKHGDSDNGTFTLAEQHLYGASRLGMKKRDLALNVANASETPATYYELTNHLGNVMAVISDEASTTAEPTVVSLSDYYPYGMAEPGRSWNAGDYRFGYTGHEKENDLAEGVYTTEYRLLDTRLGRWLSVDPLFMKYPGMSSYNYCGGNPMDFIDPNGTFNLQIDKEDEAKLTDDQRAGLARFENILKNIGNFLKDGKGNWLEDKINTISEITGLKPDEIKGHMGFGNGPTVRIVIDGNGAMQSSSGEGEPHEIEVDAVFLNDLACTNPQDYRKKWDIKNYENYMVLGAVLILFHEYGHWGDQETNTVEVPSDNGKSVKRRYTTGQHQGPYAGFKEKFSIDEGKQHDKISRTGHRGMDMTALLFGLDVIYDYRLLLPLNIYTIYRTVPGDNNSWKRGGVLSGNGNNGSNSNPYLVNGKTLEILKMDDGKK